MTHFYIYPEHTRGDICVLRSCNGKLEALRIVGNWAEFSGAFSLI